MLRCSIKKRRLMLYINGYLLYFFKRKKCLLSKLLNILKINR
ncbi:hypothetical protein HMPREF9371_0721 [Neisseria shayeganii 871]|uniref:Uncharacterized protein n=1 Tax=Neisseria shayeganii 871 TaxID=1032488 RepID=G4CGI2_9NEIS|nr:hypothetical protein HMPREF9371_0721 [Neisseria shayeganii 871]